MHGPGAAVEGLDAAERGSGAAGGGHGAAVEGRDAAGDSPGTAVEAPGAAGGGPGAAAEAPGEAVRGAGAPVRGAGAAVEGSATPSDGPGGTVEVSGAPARSPGPQCSDQEQEHPPDSTHEAGPAARDGQPWLAWMDPNSAFTLKIRLFGNKKKMRDDYTYGVFEMVVDSDYMDLVEEIVDKRPPGYLEVAHLQYYDDVLKTFPELKCDQDLMSMFEKHSKTKVVDMFISYCDPSEPFQPILEWPNCVSKENGQEEDSYLCNPLPENEHVGVDEEVLYLENAPVEVVTVHKDKEQFDEDEGEDLSEDDTDLVVESGSELESDEELVEQAANMEYDKDDPPMKVGSTYPNMAEFNVALQSYAIKREFEYTTTKSAPYRLMAYCSRKAEENCAWRLHASVKDDLKTIVVKTHTEDHSCSSTIRKENAKNPTKYWVCSKVKDWLIEDGTLKARELQKKLKEHYKVKIHYKKVWNVLLQELNISSETNDNWIWFMNRVKEVAEVTALEGSGFRFVVNLAQKTCSCRQWQVSGIPCKHAIAFITSLPNAPLEKYVDMYYSVEKFRAAYENLIPAMPDKHHWPKSTHGFFMHPPLLKATAGRPKTERYKGCSEKTKTKGQHQCPICKDYGHHWPSCKKGNPEDIAAMMTIRGPPKKKAKLTKTSESSIVPLDDDAPATPIKSLDITSSKYKKNDTQSTSSHGPSKSLETTSKTKRKNDSSASESKRSRSGSNQPEPLSIELPTLDAPPAKQKTKKKVPTKKTTSIPMAPLDSPAMGTRSKKVVPSSPGMSTRSKRRLSM